jgi:hypothetical protein
MRPAAELTFLTAGGAVMALLGPYGSDALPAAVRWPYWLISIVGGGVIGVGVDRLLARWIGRLWLRVLAASLVMTPLVCLLVVIDGRLVVGPRMFAPKLPDFLWQVLIISLVVMAVRALVWRAPRVTVETRTVVEAPLPEAEAAFRRRLSARRRTARLIAVEAHDHYLRVHTDAGAELVTLRMADAMDELSAAHGFRTHRSWWVAAGAIEGVQWRKGAGEVRLAGGLAAPVSRSYAPALKEAGWF